MRKRNIYIILVLLLVSCGQVPVIEPAQQPSDHLKENRINANRIVAQSEETQIDAYVARRGWQMQGLTGGARVMETESLGRTIVDGDTVAVVYSVEDLGGNIIYDRKADTLVAGRLMPTRGFDAALLTLHLGSSAVVVTPSEQGHGVVGDGDRIGSRTVLVYKIKVNGTIHETHNKKINKQ